MKEISFEALGTVWRIFIDHDAISETLQRTLQEQLSLFERRFLRFLPESEVNQFRNAQAGTYTISETLLLLLSRAARLRELTDGRYDPAVGELLEQAGYGRKKEASEQNNKKEPGFSCWLLADGKLVLDGPVAFDLGGIAKGYAIDQIAQTLHAQGYQYFLVEGGGDIYATTKHDQSPYRVALEWPGRPDMAFGVVELRHQAVAVSDSFKRRFGDWHHIVDVKIKKPIETVIGAAAVAKSAFLADQMTSGLFLAPEEQYETLRTELEAEYVVFPQYKSAYTGQESCLRKQKSKYYEKKKSCCKSDSREILRAKYPKG